ncbi:hypothetical protein [Echinimonas agarilytica]|uniref:DUF4397 domain-containing protein n=1 Tax=Echinimonas agarilytica TaxID=1215918 RepID=A0AA41W6S0_9GAMM|nr:hypothetical protein [Echinimonas agarilytica]MCM2679513.1 hypothetical protein [Echinimonas agarilytica]
MFSMPLQKFVAIGLATSVLAACGGGGGGSDSGSDETTLQIYNASSNSTYLKVELGDEEYTFSNLSFADATSTSTIDNGTYDITISGVDSNGEYEEVHTTTGNVDKNNRNLFVFSGPYNDLQLHTIDFSVSDIEDEYMRLFIGDFSTDSTGYDIYIGESGTGFDLAEKVATTQYGSVELSGEYLVDTYDVYITDVANDEVLFTAESVSMSSETAYFLLLRDTFGPSDTGIALDRVTSSTTVYHYEDSYGDAQFRIISAYPETVNISLQSGSASFDYDDVETAETTPYKVVEYNDYSVTVTDLDDQVLINNVLLSLPQNDTKAAVIYVDEEGHAKGLSFDESVRELAYQSDLNFVNLANDIEQVDVYFVAPGETIESTNYSFESVDFEEVENGVIPTDSYQITVVVDNDDDTQFMLYQSDMIEFDDDKNYSLVLYKDDSATFGYNMVFAAE